jgi:hypothetical protein
MRYLTKSRYKLGLECPNKLYYTKKDQYANQKQNDPFLQALALDAVSQIIALIFKKSEKLKEQYAALIAPLNFNDTKELDKHNTDGYMSKKASLYTKDLRSRKEGVKELLSGFKLMTLSMVIIYKYIETLDHECI